MLDANSIFRVDGIVAVVTGGGTGVGWMISEALAVNGAAKVFLLGRRMDVLQEAAAKHPGVMVPVQCDVTSKDSLQAAAAAVAAATGGHINLLVANSGVGGEQIKYDATLALPDLRAQLMRADADAFTDTFRVNVTGAWFTMVAFLELLDAGNRHGGFGAPAKDGGAPSVQSQVVFTASLAAFSRAHWTAPDYGGSKAAVVHMTKAASTNLARYGIRVNAIAPGIFPSDMTTGMMGQRRPDEETPADAAWIPSRKFGGEEEMAGTILYLAGRSGAFTNGCVLLCDGGRSSIIPGTY